MYGNEKGDEKHLQFVEPVEGFEPPSNPYEGFAKPTQLYRHLIFYEREITPNQITILPKFLEMYLSRGLNLFHPSPSIQQTL